MINVLLQTYQLKKQCLNYTGVFKSRKGVSQNMLKQNGKNNYTEILQEALTIILKLLERHRLGRLGYSSMYLKFKITENLSPGYIHLYNWKGAFPRCILNQDGRQKLRYK